MKILFLGGHLDKQIVNVTIGRTSSTLRYSTPNGVQRYFPWSPTLYMAYGTGGNVRRFKVTVGVKRHLDFNIVDLKRKMDATAAKAAKERFGQHEMVLIDEKFFNQDHHIRGTYDYYIYFPKSFSGCADAVELEEDLTSFIST